MERELNLELDTYSNIATQQSVLGKKVRWAVYKQLGRPPNQMLGRFRQYRTQENIVKLEQFLVKAKVSAYANAGEGGEETLADGCKELTFQEGEFKYRDRYFGWNPFVGEEVVWQDNQIIWAMNYYGLVFDEVIPAGQVYAFLQQAMNQVKEDRPFRGPQSLKKDDYEYLDESQGSVERFTGVERIFYQGREIYRLNYHGGKVK